MKSFKDFILEMIHYDYSRDDNDITHYNIVHKQSGKVVSKAKTKNGARKAVDNWDNKYGSYAHKAVAVYGPKE